jgi:hypothetical protein
MSTDIMITAGTVGLAAVGGSLVAVLDRGSSEPAGEIFGGNFTSVSTEMGLLVGFVVLAGGAAVQYIRYFMFGKQTSSTVHSFLTLATLTIIGIFIANSGNPHAPSIGEQLLEGAFPILRV